MPEVIKTNVKLVVIICGFLVTIFTGGVGYGQLSSKVADTSTKVKEHCANQQSNDKDLAIVLSGLQTTNVALATEVKNLKESVTELKQEIRKMR